MQEYVEMLGGMERSGLSRGGEAAWSLQQENPAPWARAGARLCQNQPPSREGTGKAGLSRCHPVFPQGTTAP